ncbi:hypothetical protein [Acrocarpospora sp. B8E8]|uniref:hypothetical protein n=1 Tax=Acrocarpospora sp. B8E8 TaxID=3153572 RepID=UPI00325F24B3
MSGPGWERRKLEVYAFWLALVACFSVGIALTLFDDDLRQSAVLSSIGLNLIASVIFAVVFSWLSGNVQQRILLENVRAEQARSLAAQESATQSMLAKVSELSTELFVKLAGYEGRFMPQATYDASDDPVVAFNKDISRSLEQSSSYAFRGTSAKFVPIRLKKAPRGSLRSVKIIMLDPRSRPVLNARAAERMEQKNSNNGSIDAMIEDIKEEIFMSVIALYDCRLFCSPEIVFVQETTATRIELFDDAIYLSWYQGPESTTKRFPETLKFGRDTFLFRVFAQDFHRRHSLEDSVLRLTRETTESELMQQLSALIGRSCTSSDLVKWRAAHAHFAQSVEAFLDNSASRPT